MTTTEPDIAQRERLAISMRMKKRQAKKDKAWKTGKTRDKILDLASTKVGQTNLEGFE